MVRGFVMKLHPVKPVQYVDVIVMVLVTVQKQTKC